MHMHSVHVCIIIIIYCNTHVHNTQSCTNSFDCSFCMLFYTLYTASSVSSLFYEGLIQKYTSVFIPVAYGGINRGKTKGAEIAVRAAGQFEPIYSSMTNALMKHLLWAGLPFVYDDPSKLDIFKETIMRAFGSGLLGTS